MSNQQQEQVVDIQPLRTILDNYVDEAGALVPVLQEAQGLYGYLPREAINAIARALRCSPSQVYAVATFYAQFRTEPQGKYVVRLCQGTACHVRGASQIMGGLERELGLKAGETTSDMMFTLESVACLGACGLAPTMVIGDTTYGLLTIDKAQKVIRKIKAQEAKGDDDNAEG